MINDDYIAEMRMKRALEDKAEKENRNTSPFCISAEQYCHAYIKDGAVACEDCSYNKGFRGSVLKMISKKEIEKLKVNDCLNGLTDKVI